MTILFASPHRAFGAVHWHHETALYFDVWDKGKAECQATYLRAMQDAEQRSTVEERRSATKAAKHERSACRRTAKDRAHAAFLQAWKERWDRIKAARHSKTSGSTE